MTAHEWRESTAEGPRIYRATRFARAWTVMTRLKSDEEWNEVEPPWPPAVAASLRDLLWAKYQRRRVPFEVVREIDARLPAALRRCDPEEPRSRPSE